MDRSIYAKVYGFATASLLLASGAAQATRFCFQNLRWWRVRVEVVGKWPSSLLLGIDLNAFRVQGFAGKYVKLYMPGLDPFLVGCPLTVAWWSDEKCRLFCLVHPKRGFTRRLLFVERSSRTAFISGPYGPKTSAHDHHSVVLVASGLGIAAVLPYAKQILHSQREDVPTKTRKTHIIWQIDALGKHGRTSRRADLTKGWQMKRIRWRTS